MPNDVDLKAKSLAEEIEETYGNEVLLKVGYSALTKLLIDKHLITRKDLNEYFIDYANKAKTEIG